MSELVPLETQTFTYFDRKYVSLHVPSLSAFAAFRARAYLDEFNLDNEAVDTKYALSIRSKISQRLMDWLEAFYRDMRHRVPMKFSDSFWLKMCLTIEHEHLREFFLGIPYPNMSCYSLEILFSYIGHLRLPETLSDSQAEALSDALGFLLLCLLRLSLKADKATVTAFNRLLKVVALKIKVNHSLLQLVMTKLLLAFPFKGEREFLLSLGADINLIWELGANLLADDVPSHPLIVAAGTGNYEYVRRICSTDSGAFNVLHYNEACQLFEDEAYTPLSAAIEANDIDMVDLLIKIGVYTEGSLSCPVRARRRDIGCGLSRGHFEILGRIIPLCRSMLSPTLFKFANDVSKASYLLQEANCPHCNALSDRDEDHNVAVVTYLVNNGSDPNKIGVSYRDFACSRPDLDTLSVCFLSERFLRGDRLFRPMINAVTSKDGPLLRLLIGTVCRAEDICDTSVLLCAVRNPNIGISELLIRGGADARTMLLLFCGTAMYTEDTDSNYRYLEWLLKENEVTDNFETYCRQAILMMENHHPYPSALCMCLHNKLRK